MGITFRQTSPEDEAFLFALYASSRERETAFWGMDALQLEGILRMQFVAQRRHYEAVYAGAEEQIILIDGAPAGRWYVARTEKEIHLLDISLLPAFRNRGLGSALLRDLQQEAGAGEKTLRLSVAEGNPAIDLYRRLGFSVIGGDGVYLGMEWTSGSAKEGIQQCSTD